MLQKICHTGLWISTIVILVLAAVQGWTGDWSVFFRAWPGSNVSQTFMMVVAKMVIYHKTMGFAIGGISVLVVIFAFLSKTNSYVRVFTILGFAVTFSAAMGGFLYVTSRFHDRLALGQMADSLIGVFAAYFLMLFFLNRIPRFPWSREKRLKGEFPSLFSFQGKHFCDVHSQ